MTASEKQHFLSLPPIAVWYDSLWGGLEIKQIEQGVEDFVVYVDGASTQKPTVHRAKIKLTTSDEPYFVYNTRNVYLRDCIRIGG